jgi:hypothetical protein
MKRVLVLFLLYSIIAPAQSTLQEEFQNPPNEARPRVWWHWMNGNITKDGIQKDLDWMERAGIGGFHNFDANLMTPLVTKKKLVFMTPEWKEAFKFTTDLAIEKGMEMTIAGSPGWSETGGPWVSPEDGMKKYVWTETSVQGGQTFKGKLNQPANVTGTFQNILVEEGGITGGYIGEKPQFYKDALVIAYQIPADERSFTELKPEVSSSGGDFSLEHLSDGDLHHTSFLPPVEVGEKSWIQYEFDSAYTFKAISVVGATTTPLAEFRGNPDNRILQVSNDGTNFRDVAKIPGAIPPQNTINFQPTKAKYWRMTWETLPPTPNPFLAMLGMPMGDVKPEGTDIAEFVLHASDRIDRFEEKAGFAAWREDTPSYVAGGADAIAKAQVLNLTDKLQEDGTLNWEVPEGNWIVLRFGFSLTGRQNHPASPEATGLEVDKLNEDAVSRYINHYLDLYKDATGGLMGEKGLSSIILDSYEAGHMTWTDDFPQEFEQRRGYSILEWIPVLTGRIVESREASEKFLWDFRKTIGEMIADNHYDVIGEELNKRGMGRYTESHENQRIFLADGMDVKRNAEVPMSAMWTPGSLGGGKDEDVRSEGDIRESASVANIYGKPFVAAESMTSAGKPFQEYPERLKRTADLELASGLNRFVIHTSVHQPLDDKMPGFSLGPFGQYFTRQETWAEQARPWVDYLSRSCHLLQQGKNVADVLYYYGENTNITWICREELPNIPPGLEFDFVNSTALIEAIEAKDGQLVAKSGNSYKVLMLDESAKWMTLPVLEKIQELVAAGVKVIGAKPEMSPSLSDDAEAFQQLADEVWQSPNIVTLGTLKLQPDIFVKKAKNEILFRHRQTEDRDIYWLNNRGAEPTSAEISFKVSGKVPKLWHPQTGKISEVTYKIQNGRTTVPLQFESWDAFFIVFEGEAKMDSHVLPEQVTAEVLKLEGSWKVSFQEGRGAPKETELTELKSLTENTDKGIKYFSGTATYHKSFSINNLVDGAQYSIDLGEVKQIAEVIINGKNMGILWKTPFMLDITEALQEGENKLEIKVTNSWVNRMIGDAQPDAATKITFATMPFYRADSELHPSGLLGAVRILEKK